MADTMIATVNKPRRNLYKHGGVEKAMTYQDCVRAFRVSPSEVQLQIRMKKDYVTVAMTPDEAFKLVDALLSAMPEEKKR